MTLGGLAAVTALSWAYLLWASTGAHGPHPAPAGVASAAAPGDPEEEDPDLLP